MPLRQSIFRQSFDQYSECHHTDTPRAILVLEMFDENFMGKSDWKYHFPTWNQFSDKFVNLNRLISSSDFKWNSTWNGFHSQLYFACILFTNLKSMTQSTITWPVHGNLRIHSLARSTCHLIKSLPITYPKSSGTAPIHDELPIDYWALCTYTITFPYPILHSILIYILTYYIPFSLPNSGHHHANDKRHQFISTGHETMYMKCMQNMEPNMASPQPRNTRPKPSYYRTIPKHFVASQSTRYVRVWASWLSIDGERNRNSQRLLSGINQQRTWNVMTRHVTNSQQWRHDAQSCTSSS